MNAYINLCASRAYASAESHSPTVVHIRIDGALSDLNPFQTVLANLWMIPSASDVTTSAISSTVEY